MKYRVNVEGRTFEIEIGPDGRVWVDRKPLSVDLEGINGLLHYSLLVDRRSYEAHVEADKAGEAGVFEIVLAGRPYRARLDTGQRSPAPQDSGQHPAAGRATGPAEIRAPLPGLLVELRVGQGQRVEAGDVVAVLESMKMHNALRTPHAGQVRALHVTSGQEVAQGDLLAVIAETGAEAEAAAEEPAP